MLNSYLKDLKMIFAKNVLDTQPRETENRMHAPKNITLPNDLRNEGAYYRETMINQERKLPTPSRNIRVLL